MPLDDGGAHAVVVERGVLTGRYRKTHLLRGEALFTPGTESPVFEVGDLRFGINICYDTNFPEAARKVAEHGATLLVCCANNMLPRKAAEDWNRKRQDANVPGATRPIGFFTAR